MQLVFAWRSLPEGGYFIGVFTRTTKKSAIKVWPCTLPRQEKKSIFTTVSLTTLHVDYLQVYFISKYKDLYNIRTKMNIIDRICMPSPVFS